MKSRPVINEQLLHVEKCNIQYFQLYIYRNASVSRIFQLSYPSPTMKCVLYGWLQGLNVMENNARIRSSLFIAPYLLYVGVNIALQLISICNAAKVYSKLLCMYELQCSSSLNTRWLTGIITFTTFCRDKIKYERISSVLVNAMIYFIKNSRYHALNKVSFK